MQSVGIVLHYRNHPYVWAALRVASYVMRRGHTVYLRSVESVWPQVDPEWDGLLLRGRPELPFADWIKLCDTVIWTGTVDPLDLQMALSNGNKTVFLVASDWLDEGYEKTLNKMHTVVVTNHDSERVLEDGGRLGNVRYIPLDTGLPITHRNSLCDGGKVSIMVAFMGGRGWSSVDDDYAVYLARLLDDYPQARLTLFITSKGFRPSVYSVLKSLSVSQSSRVRLVRSNHYSRDQRLVLLSEHDLLVWPVLKDAYAILAREAMAMGTPVLMRGIPSVADADMVGNRDYFRASLSSPTTDKIGQSSELPGARSLDTDVRQRLDEPWDLLKVSHGCRRYLQDSARLFVAGWNSILRY